MIWVEVQGRHGHAAQRVRLSALPASIGRAWSCDVVLDDRHVDPVHARLVRDEQGTLVLEDAGSLNGLVTPAGRMPRVAVTGPVTVQLGQTTVRLVPAASPVAPAVPLPPPTRGVRALVSTPRRAAAIVLLGLVASAAAFWAGDPDADSPRSVVGGVLGLAAVVAAWAGVWALVGRSAVQHARFLAHFAAAWLALLAIEVVAVAGDWAGFALNIGGLAATLDVAAGLVVVGTLLAVHFALATAMTPRRRTITAAAIVLGIAGAAALLDETAREASGENDVAITASVRPVPPSLVRTDDFDAFLAGAASLRREVDALAKEAERQDRLRRPGTPRAPAGAPSAGRAAGHGRPGR